MNYEQKYKDALERAKKWHNAPNADKIPTLSTRIIEEIFPELKESEDERIMKWCISHFKACINVIKNNDEYKKYLNNKVIPWLEKTKDKEAKLIISDEGYNKAFQDGIEEVLTNSHKYGLEAQDAKVSAIEGFETEFERQVSGLIASAINKEYEYNQGYVKWTANALLNYAKHELEKQGEQKPIISNNALKEGIAHFGITQYQIDNWLKKYVDVEKQREQKPADNVDVLMSLDEAIEHCKEKSCGNNACALEHKQLEKWLTELKELKEQNPAWSEEDEKKLNYLIALLQNSTMTNVALSATNEGIEDFLKSLKYRYTWKPSSEQIEAIRLARSFVVDDFSEKPTLSDILVELEKQLKKL